MVDTQALLQAVVGVGTAFLAVAFLVIIAGGIADAPNIFPDNLVGTNTSTGLGVINNVTVIIGSVVTTWGTIIILGIIVITVFIGILGAMMALSSLRMGER